MVATFLESREQKNVDKTCWTRIGTTNRIEGYLKEPVLCMLVTGYVCSDSILPVWLCLKKTVLFVDSPKLENVRGCLFLSVCCVFSLLALVCHARKISE